MAQRYTERRGDPAGRPYIRNDVGEEESEGVHALSVAQVSEQNRNICFDFEGGCVNGRSVVGATRQVAPTTCRRRLTVRVPARQFHIFDSPSARDKDSGIRKQKSEPSFAALRKSGRNEIHYSCTWDRERS